MKWLLLGLLSMMTMNAKPSFDELVDRYFADQFRLNPSNATAAGFHQPYDSQLEDYSAKAFAERIAVEKKYLVEFQTQPDSDDCELMISHIKADLLNAEQIRQQVTNPDVYSSGVTASIFSLISRNFAPPEERMKSVIAREEKIPQVLQDARQQLKDCPKIYTEVAIEQLPGIQSFFLSDVPKAFESVHDAPLRARFNKTNAGVVEALKNYEHWLKADLLPRSHGDFKIGADNYAKKVLYEEMVDTPLDRLLAIGYENLRQNQKQLVEICKKIDASKTPEQIVAKFEHDYPPPDQLLNKFRATFTGLIYFINTHRIITIPTTVRPILEETPPFARALTTASMDTPGPYEKVATEAYFNVTLPEKSWSVKETEEFMTAFNRGTITSTAIHEAYPGHYVQLIWLKQVSSKVRKLVSSNSNVEGWAHYTEQMMLDEGYGGQDPELRVGQLLDALLRNCRYIVGIEMHTGKKTFEQGIAFFQKEGFMSRAYAERETKRGTSDPTYLVYTLGKLEILKLRADYQKKMGPKFSLQQFHDEFMQQGGVPIKLIRKKMLGIASASVL